jgi:hypothetical protein
MFIVEDYLADLLRRINSLKRELESYESGGIHHSGGRSGADMTDTTQTRVHDLKKDIAIYECIWAEISAKTK